MLLTNYSFIKLYSDSEVSYRDANGDPDSFKLSTITNPKPPREIITS